ncbi:hypothetical protein J5N97_017133 [Dioscorea zingiberensis]|uniref:Uncharacterized protein n=1 Tax=Dioscorea zingiberensis TaxID=325984 RepID=A0A9D5HG98_9LILI|nr:hypothetical protein J5N97_017133 [Dioscorea zingiberensis]
MRPPPLAEDTTGEILHNNRLLDAAAITFRAPPSSTASKTSPGMSLASSSSPNTRGAAMMVILKVLSAFLSRNLILTKLKVINPVITDRMGLVMVLDVCEKGSLRAFPQVLYVDFEGSLEDSRFSFVGGTLEARWPAARMEGRRYGGRELVSSRGGGAPPTVQNPCFSLAVIHSIGCLSKIHELSLPRNLLFGLIPLEIARGCAFKIYDLRGNRLSSSIPGISPSSATLSSP